MERVDSVSIAICGIALRFRFPTPVQLGSEFTAFLCDDSVEPDEIFQVQLLMEPLVPDVPVYAKSNNNLIYQTDKGWLRIYSSLTAEDGCQVACLFCPDGNHTLYYPASQWESYIRDDFRCMHLICAELLLIRRSAFLLHSSMVMIHDRIILFSGPSGAGKSTQADLWAKFTDAQVINGDRCVIMEQEGKFYGGGSPWCGTSGIRRREQAPIAGIFLVKQADENSIQRLQGLQAFLPLFSQTLVNSWDSQFMAQLTSLYERLLARIPVYKLNCRVDEEAVRLVYRTLF